jgi:HPt (histidine-containing phosphotransfer) domain-containing protein
MVIENLLDPDNPSNPEDHEFVGELLVTFCVEGLKHLQAMLQTAHAFHERLPVPSTEPDGSSHERSIREHAHALKGSAGGVRLQQVWQAAERVELPLKKLIYTVAYDGSVSQPAATAGAVLATMHEVIGDGATLGLLGELVEAFTAFVSKFEEIIDKHIAPAAHGAIRSLPGFASITPEHVSEVIAEARRGT